MTQWKIGDKAEVVVAVDNLRIGDQVEVVSLDENGFPIFNTDKDHEMGWESVDEYYKKVAQSNLRDHHNQRQTLQPRAGGGVMDWWDIKPIAFGCISGSALSFFGLWLCLSYHAPMPYIITFPLNMWIIGFVLLYLGVWVCRIWRDK